MIKIRKDYTDTPVSLASPSRIKLILDSLVLKNTHKFNSKIYRDTTLESLNELYHSKCAYCETNTAAGAPMQVEHYRPKAKVTNENNHFGYYWLAYEWSNLLLSCSKCNRGKGNHFPITGNRINAPELNEHDGLPNEAYCYANSLILLGEQALLLNPEIDDVEKDFYFNIDGSIIGISDRAKQTIQICHLNRKELVFKRLQIINSFKAEIKDILADFLNHEISSAQCRDSIKRVFKRMAVLQNPEKQYSRLGYFLFYKFDLFIAASLEDKQKNAVLKLFDQFKNGNL